MAGLAANGSPYAVAQPGDGLCTCDGLSTIASDRGLSPFRALFKPHNLYYVKHDKEVLWNGFGKLISALFNRLRSLTETLFAQTTFADGLLNDQSGNHRQLG